MSIENVSAEKTVLSSYVNANCVTFGMLMKSQEIIRREDAPETPMISVIMPTYKLRDNGLTQRSIEGVLEQSYKDFEFILVDDGSIDGLFDVLKEYQRKDPRVVIIRNEVNSGLPGARANQGILASKGKYITYMFEDDLWYEEALEALLSPQLEYGDCISYAAVDWQIIRHVEGQESVIEKKLLGNVDVNPAILKGENLIANCAICHPRNVMDECGLYDPHILIRRACDWDLWIRMSSYLPFRRVDRVIGKVTSGLNDSLGVVVHLDLNNIRQYVFTQRDSLLCPEVINNYKVDSLDLFDDYGEKELLFEEKILPFKVLYPELSSENYHGVDNINDVPGKRYIITKTDYSTSIDVTLNNYKFLLGDGNFNSTFYPERILQGFCPENYDSLIVYRSCVPSTHAYMLTAKESGKACIYMMDDNMFQFGTGYLADQFPYLKPGTANYRAVENLVQDSDIVISYSDEITQDCKKRNPRVVQLKTNILSNYVSGSEPPLNDAKLKQRIKYAFLSGYARKEELKKLWPQIEKFARKYKKTIEIHFWGMDPEEFGRLDCPTYYQPFCHSYYKYLESLGIEKLDFSICPLFDDHATKRSKSPVKFLEGTVAGAVGIFSDVNVYSEMKDSIDCLKVDNKKESGWFDTLEKSFLLSLSKRKEIFEKAKARVLKFWTSESQTLELLSAFEAGILHNSLQSCSVNSGKAKIAYFVHECLFGGATIHLLAHAKILQSYRFEPVFVVRKGSAGIEDFTRRCDQCKIEVIELIYTPSISKVSLDDVQVGHAEEISQWFKSEDIRMVHCVTYCPAVIYAANISGIPVVSTLHQHYPSANNSIKPGEIFPEMSAIHSSSLRYARLWCDEFGVPARAIAAPIEQKYFDEFDERDNADSANGSCINLLVSGTVQPRKGQLNLIKAISILKGNGVTVKLHIIGYDNLSLDYVEECRNAIKDLGLEEWVDFAGFVNDPYSYYKNADILICSSIDESMPQAILKSMAMGIFVITTPVGGVKEVVMDGFSGLVTKGFEPEDLAEAIQKYASMSFCQKKKVLNRAHLTAKMKCSVDVVAYRLLKLYNLATKSSSRKTNSEKEKTENIAVKKSPERCLVTANNGFFARQKRFLKRLVDTTAVFAHEKVGIVELLKFFRKEDHWSLVSPIFEKFKKDSVGFNYKQKGCRLVVAGDLKEKSRIYPLHLNGCRLKKINLAIVPLVNELGGDIVIEIIAPDGSVLANGNTPLNEYRQGEPFSVEFSTPVLIDARKGWKFRVSAVKSSGMVKVFEFTKPSFATLNVCRYPFCAFETTGD